MKKFFKIIGDHPILTAWFLTPLLEHFVKSGYSFKSLLVFTIEYILTTLSLYIIFITMNKIFNIKGK